MLKLITRLFKLSILNRNFKMDHGKVGVLNQLNGLDGRCNDVLFYRPNDNEYDSVVVFFGGDVQNYTANMLKNVDSEKFSNWSLENTILLLAKSFPKSFVMIVKPVRMEMNTLSCFENFVQITMGIPTFSASYSALNHLEALIKAIDEQKVGDILNKNLHIIGFSKGCVVLTQFVHEFNNTSISSEIVPRIKKMTWLDSGHSGNCDAWITSEELVKKLVSLGIEIDIKVTPYQICCRSRPWIGVEEKQFCNLLQNHGANFKETVYFEDEKPNLLRHFELLTKLHE